MTKDIEHYHRELLSIIGEHALVTGPPVSVDDVGHAKIRALVEEIHDQGYALGQQHDDQRFPPPAGFDDWVSYFRSRAQPEGP